MESQDFGDQLRRHRMSVRMTQQQLADFSTLSVRAIRDLERGRAQRPRYDTVRLLAEVLRLDGRQRENFESVSRGLPELSTVRGVDVTRFVPPVAPAEIVGRDAEARVLTDLLTVHGQRLVAVVGVAGVGKTRLLLDVAGIVQRDADWSVLWVPAADLDGLPAADLAATIGDRDTLLVVDGHGDARIPAALVDVLHQCRGTRVVITAVDPGSVTGAQVFPLPPLEVPTRGDEDDLVALAQVGSVRLLITQLRRFRPTFRLRGENAAAVAGLCRALDGIPRALEFAAAWCLVHTPEQLLEEIRRDPLTLRAPLTATADSPDLWASMRRTLDTVDPALREHLNRLAELDGAWSIPEAAGLIGCRTAELAWAVQALLIQGVIRCRAGRFAVLNLVQALYTERKSARAGGRTPGVTRPGRPRRAPALGVPVRPPA
ncbi:helix-turn-helix domain-containing protein [Actinoplanes sp. NPDC049548]|uniref:helix-turn-helix domain-containing protein n=1 Tax=Actinoplanes sp. NPDC049548 TaxID=3155152 RepID=UPI0034129058